jgi:hypothetical protein
MFDSRGTSLTRGSTRFFASWRTPLFHANLIFAYFSGKGATLFSTPHSSIIRPFVADVNEGLTKQLIHITIDFYVNTFVC